MTRGQLLAPMLADLFSEVWEARSEEFRRERLEAACAAVADMALSEAPGAARRVIARRPNNTNELRERGLIVQAQSIIAEVAGRHGVEVGEMYWKRGGPELQAAREEAYWILSRTEREPGRRWSLRELAVVFQRDFSWISIGIRRHRDRLASLTSAHEDLAHVG